MSKQNFLSYIYLYIYRFVHIHTFYMFVNNHLKSFFFSSWGGSHEEGGHGKVVDRRGSRGLGSVKRVMRVEGQSWGVMETRQEGAANSIAC